MAHKCFSTQELRELRNQIPIRAALEQLCGCDCKEVEEHLRFVCPICHEMRTSIHPHENLGRCFRCERNFNPIDLLMASLKLSFVESVKLLQAKKSQLQAATASVAVKALLANSASNMTCGASNPCNFMGRSLSLCTTAFRSDLGT